MARIVGAAIAIIDDTGAMVSMADVARSLGVIRQTVYRYFPNADALMKAVAIASVDAFLDRIEAHLRGITDPREAVTEGTAYVLETLPRTPHLGLLLSPVHADRGSQQAITSGQARAFAQSMLQRFDVDWPAHGYDDTALAELAEFILRTVQSFSVDPGDPPRTGERLRTYLDRWVGTAVAAQPVSGSAPGRT